MDQYRQALEDERRQLTDELAITDAEEDRAQEIRRRLIDILLELEDFILQDMANMNPYVDSYDRAKG